MHASELLSLWTIYDHPTDYPGHFVARRFVVGHELDKPFATDEIMAAERIEDLREVFLEMGLVKIEREMVDEAQIVETWL